MPESRMESVLYSCRVELSEIVLLVSMPPAPIDPLREMREVAAFLILDFLTFTQNRHARTKLYLDCDPAPAVLSAIRHAAEFSNVSATSTTSASNLPPADLQPCTHRHVTAPPLLSCPGPPPPTTT